MNLIDSKIISYSLYIVQEQYENVSMNRQNDESYTNMSSQRLSCLIMDILLQYQGKKCFDEKIMMRVTQLFEEF